MPPKAGAHSIVPCVRGCGFYTRPKRLAADVAKVMTADLFGPDAVVFVNTGQGVCGSCWRAEENVRKDAAKAKKAASDAARNEARAVEKADLREKVSAERLELARIAAASVTRDRERRAMSNRPRRVGLGQSMVRI